MVGFFFSGSALCCSPVATMPQQLPGTHMNTESNAVARPSPSQEADAALQAITGQAKSENLSRIAELSEGTDDAHVAEHIRGMVAATMSHLSADAPALTRLDAEQWQNWALGVADGVALTVPAAV
jgi:hypothetical protein